MSEARFIVADVFEAMAAMPDNSVDVVICSPPFLALRSYLPADHPDKAKEIGSEPTPAAFLSTLLALTKEWRRILAPHGSICVELGDTYSGSGGAGGDYGEGGLREGQPTFKAAHGHDAKHANQAGRTGGTPSGPGWPLAKSLCGIPDAYALSLEYGWNMLNPTEQCDKWRVRNKIVWHRPNPPVGALGDKVRPSTSYITVACVSSSRWFDLDAERTPGNSFDRPIGRSNGNKGVERDDVKKWDDHLERNPAGAPLLDCWTIPTAPYQGAHYATFPPALPRKLINLMCPRQICRVCGEPRRRITETTQVGNSPNGQAVANGRKAESPVHAIRTEARVETLGWSDCGHNTWRRGIVLDPFGGSATTGMAASELGRDPILIDLDERNLELARQRLGLFLVEGEPTQDGAHANA